MLSANTRRRFHVRLNRWERAAPIKPTPSKAREPGCGRMRAVALQTGACDVPSSSALLEVPAFDEPTGCHRNVWTGSCSRVWSHRIGVAVHEPEKKIAASATRVLVSSALARMFVLPRKNRAEQMSKPRARFASHWRACAVVMRKEISCKHLRDGASRSCSVNTMWIPKWKFEVLSINHDSAACVQR